MPTCATLAGSGPPPPPVLCKITIGHIARRQRRGVLPIQKKQSGAARARLVELVGSASFRVSLAGLEIPAQVPLVEGEHFTTAGEDDRDVCTLAPAEWIGEGVQRTRTEFCGHPLHQLERARMDDEYFGGHRKAQQSIPAHRNTGLHAALCERNLLCRWCRDRARGAGARAVAAASAASVERVHYHALRVMARERPVSKLMHLAVRVGGREPEGLSAEVAPNFWMGGEDKRKRMTAGKLPNRSGEGEEYVATGVPVAER
ncbi:hypothetical protein EDB86DRAFT_2830760 [Lactarius hatsudake]|nr:hypothetical protein EDB86DRAFT_2830760 [Lactarius hatsudake]